MSLKFSKKLAMVTVSNVNKSNEIFCNGNRNEEQFFLVFEIYFCLVDCRKSVSADEPQGHLFISEYRLKLGKTNPVINIMV